MDEWDGIVAGSHKLEGTDTWYCLGTLNVRVVA